MEERGYILYVPNEEEPGKDSEVFYNSEMVLNRDISEIAGKVFREAVETEDFRVCDALSASGIRGLRYSKISTELHLNDANPEAVKSIQKALEANNVEAETHKRDANVLLSDYRNYFHLIDIDPFGPFTNYLDSTARAANHQSLIGLTATDNAVPTGSYKKTCRRRYSSEPLKNSFMHETALRIYIKEVFQNFARYDKAFEPRICFHERHYSRVIGRVTESKKRTNKNLDNIGFLSFCRSCRWRKLERVERCENCGSKTEIAGPLWTGKIIDIRFTEKVLEKIPKEWEGSLEMVKMLHNEGELLAPFYDIHELASNMKISVPKRRRVIEEIGTKGYPVSRTHFSPTGFRTDAPINDIKTIIRELSESDNKP